MPRLNTPARPNVPSGLAADRGLHRVGDVLDEHLPGERRHLVGQPVQIGRQDRVHGGEVGAGDVDVAVARRQRRDHRAQAGGEHQEEDLVGGDRRHEQPLAGRAPVAQRQVETEPVGGEEQAVAAGALLQEPHPAILARNRP
ncbi:hypothetical protein ACFSTC_08695 [Nonomuraea ferruginea]